MNVMLIDTSSDMEIVALSAGGRTHSVAAPAERSHAATLFGNIDSCLKALSLDMGDINLLSVGIGPGSFTGVRIAVSTARMIAQILTVPLVGLPSQEIYARSVQAAAGEQILIAFDAKKNRVFGGLYLLDRDDRLAVLASPGDYDIEDLIKAADRDRTTISAGNGIMRYAGTVSSLIPGHRYRAEIIPDAKTLSASAVERFSEKPDFFRDYRNTIPFYARKSDAELIKQAKMDSTAG